MFIDDILIGGKDLKECLKILEMVSERLAKYNVTVNLKKCQFLKEEIQYLGHVICKEGIKPNLKKVDAIKNAPTPLDLEQLRSYLGLINYYSKFIPNLSSELKVLYDLTKKNVRFVWSNKCDIAFKRSKELLLGNNLLAYYDPNKEIVLHCDASPYWVGGILSHVIDGVDPPVMFVSSTLSSAEQNYAQLQREALFGCSVIEGNV